MAEQTTIRRGRNSDPASHPGAYDGVSPIKVNKLGHLVYEVSDVERTTRFWTEVMGFVETDRNEFGMVFFRCGADHHAIALKPATAGRRPGPDAGMMIDHLAFEVDNIDVLLAALGIEGVTGGKGLVGVEFKQTARATAVEVKATLTGLTLPPT